MYQELNLKRCVLRFKTFKIIVKADMKEQTVP